MTDQSNKTNGCVSDIDRLSDLPDYLLHHIISFLGTKEACRTSILSKRWLNIWATGLILDFNPHLFENVPFASWETSDRFVCFTETTTQWYFDQNLSIRKLTLKCQNVDKEMTGRIDRWLRIAVENQIEDLSLDIAGAYMTPLILFSAKSLISLRCSMVRVPRYPSVMLTSLQSLDLSSVDIDEHMLHHIIMFCPLKKLYLRYCFGIDNLSIPKCTKLELLHVESADIGGSLEVETSRIQHFTYYGQDWLDSGWPFNFSLASKKNLSELYVSCISILGNVVDKLVTELSSIKIMTFNSCILTENIRFTSLTLEVLEIERCHDLVNINLDTPQLKTFCFTAGDIWYLNLDSVTNSHPICNAHLYLTECFVDTESLIRINSLLSRSNCGKVLSIDFSHKLEIEFDMDELSKIHDAPPYEIEELKLSLSCSTSKESYVITLLDVLFWSCRPTILSISIAFDNWNAIVELLQEKVKCWNHPTD